MEQALKNRLTYGPLMLAGLFGLLWLDHAIETWTHGWLGKLAPQERGVGGVGILALLFIILPMAVWELARLFSAENVRPYRWLTGIGSGLLVIHAFCTQFPKFQPIAASTLAFILVMVMIAVAVTHAVNKQSEQAIVHMAGTVLAMLYLGGLAWFIIALRVKHSQYPAPEGFHGSTMTILMMLLVVKFTDIGAYFGGRALGRHKLIPWLSPGKTWEGLICGVLTAGVVGAVCAAWILNLHWYRALAFGVVIGAVGQAGDLFESMMKRDADVKDSGKMIPGFGGILDVIDSPLLAAPFAYVVFSLFAR